MLPTAASTVTGKDRMCFPIKTVLKLKASLEILGTTCYNFRLNAANVEAGRKQTFADIQD